MILCFQQHDALGGKMKLLQVQHLQQASRALNTSARVSGGNQATNIGHQFLRVEHYVIVISSDQ